MLRQRVITAVVAALALLLGLFYLPEPAMRIVICALLLVGCWEWTSFFGSGRAERVAFVLVCAALMAPNLLDVLQTAHLVLILKVAVAWWLAALIWIFFYPTPVPRPIAWVSGLLTVLPAYVALDWLFRENVWLLLFALVVVWAADIGAYFSGKAFGRVKLAPVISPGKTWEGVLGGMLAVSVIAVSASVYAGAPVTALLPLCLAAAACSIIGDLTVSMFKRHSGVKDSGTLFPGHGGFLDRADGVMAATPLFTLGLYWLGGTRGIYAL